MSVICSYRLVFVIRISAGKALCFKGKALFMSNFYVKWYFLILKQLADSTVFPELNKVMAIQEDFPWKVFSTTGMERSLGSSSC